MPIVFLLPLYLGILVGGAFISLFGQLFRR